MSHTLWVVQFWVKLLVGSWCKGNPIGNFFRIIRKEELKVSWRKEPLSPTPKPDTALNSKFYFCTISYRVHIAHRERDDLDLMNSDYSAWYKLTFYRGMMICAVFRCCALGMGGSHDQPRRAPVHDWQSAAIHIYSLSYQINFGNDFL